jgi:methionyl-tRNA formyltransferase
MLKTIILLTGNTQQHRALTALLQEHNPDLSFHCALTRDDLTGLESDLLRQARLVSFTSGVIVPRTLLRQLGHGAYNFHPGPPQYPGWAPAHFALYDDARTFGATAHAMEVRVDSGPIIGAESFAIPENISVRELERIAFERLAHLFWRMSREIACGPGVLPALPISWSGTKSTKRMYRELCEIPPGVGAAELKRRIRAFDDNFRGIPLTVTLHGQRFRLISRDLPRAEPPQIDAPPIAIAS